MRSTDHARGLRPVLALAALVLVTGCQKIPYIDMNKPVPSQPMSTIEDVDREVKAANFTGGLPLPLPKTSKPRTPENPEAQEIWQLSLPEAIRIGLENSEVVRVISLGAQGIPVGGFEPTPLNTGAGAGVSSALGAGTLASVYDPAVQETQIAQALSAFDANLSTTLFWGKSETPLNNAIQAGTFTAGARFPIIFLQDTGQLQATLQKRAANGAILQLQHNISYLYSNSPGNVYPSAYTTNTQFRITQPLLGGTAQNPSGLEANRAPIVIARINADAAVWSFKAAVMAHVRSIEQQYWALSQQQIQLWSRETAVALGERVLERERLELEQGRATTADVAEAQQQLERFQLAYITATSDVITTERQLRNILGLPPADNRRIVPVTAPVEARLEPDWETSLAQMLSFQPDIVQQQLLVRLSELQLLVARNQLLPVLNLDALYQLNGLGRTLDSAEAVMTGTTLRALDPLIAQRQRAAGVNTSPVNFRDFQQWQIGLTFQVPIGFRAPLASVRQSQYQLLRQRAFLQQIIHQQTHSLARFFTEVDANYKQFRTAQRLRAAAQVRLEASRTQYQVGKIAIDRVLDAVSQYAEAIAQEAQFKTSYNTSIAALEEAKGTLLAYDNVAVAEGPHPRKAYIQARDQRNAHRELPGAHPGDLHPEPRVAPGVPDPVTPMAPLESGNDQPKGLFPAPVGPFGPRPSFVPPTVPAGEPNVSSRMGVRNPLSVDSGVRPAGASGSSDLPPLPGEGPAPMQSPANRAIPAPLASPSSPVPPAAARPKSSSRPISTTGEEMEVPSLPTSPPPSNGAPVGPVPAPVELVLPPARN
ncbi:MAG: TolC family protein [Isosphaeraceae bacterium]|nr:TolC family protein [Isosphaeraceae bacterium]